MHKKRLIQSLRSIALPLAATAMIGALLAPALVQAEMYRWVDKNGVAHYGDRVPPQNARQRREVLNEYGQTVTVKEREPTAQELEAARLEREREQAEQAAAARQAQYDRSLTATYSRVEQLDAAYADRLAIVDSKLSSARSTHADIQATLAPMLERASAENPEPGLDKRIGQTRERLREQEAIISRLNSDRAMLEEKRESDRARFLLLTSHGN